MGTIGVWCFPFLLWFVLSLPGLVFLLPWWSCFCGLVFSVPCYPLVIKHGNGQSVIYICFSQLETSIYRGFSIATLIFHAIFTGSGSKRKHQKPRAIYKAQGRPWWGGHIHIYIYIIQISHIYTYISFSTKNSYVTTCQRENPIKHHSTAALKAKIPSNIIKPLFLKA